MKAINILNILCCPDWWGSDGKQYRCGKFYCNSFMYVSTLPDGFYLWTLVSYTNGNYSMACFNSTGPDGFCECRHHVQMKMGNNIGCDHFYWNCFMYVSTLPDGFYLWMSASCTNEKYSMTSTGVCYVRSGTDLSCLHWYMSHNDIVG